MLYIALVIPKDDRYSHNITKNNKTFVGIKSAYNSCMKIETQEIIDRVLFMDFDSQWDLAMSFVRIQEFQESPKFRGKYFTLDQYMDYWVKGQGEGKWDYPNRWGGFNLSGKIIEKFMLKFDDLRDKEKEIVNIIDHYVSSKENKKTSMKDIYVIAAKGYREKTINHETAHALYYLNPKYRRECNRLLKSIPQEKYDKGMAVLLKMGYGKNIINDELQAYFSTNTNEFTDISIMNEFKDNYERFRNG